MFFVRTAAETDLERVREILLVTYHATYDQLVGSETVDMICAEHFSPDALADLRDLPSSEFLVADNGEVVGGMAYATQSGKVITLHQLHVHPLYHGGKTGLHLMIEIENSFLDAETVRAGDELAFGYTSATDTNLAVFDVDGGKATSIFPAGAETFSAAAGVDVELDVAVALDGSTSEESIVAVFCEQPQPIDVLREPLEAGSALPTGCEATWTALPKERR